MPALGADSFRQHFLEALHSESLRERRRCPTQGFQRQERSLSSDLEKGTISQTQDAAIGFTDTLLDRSSRVPDWRSLLRMQESERDTEPSSTCRIGDTACLSHGESRLWSSTVVQSLQIEALYLPLWG